MKKVSQQLRERIVLQAQNRCGYCLSPQHLVLAKLEIEHIIPKSKGGSDSEENLWLACPLCNRYKADKIEAIDVVTQSLVPLFNPRFQFWYKHFEWLRGGIYIGGLTAVGRATVEGLHLNDPTALIVRSYWIEAGWHPPRS